MLNSAPETISLLQKMSEWVAVCADEAEEPVEIPTEADGESVPLFDILTFFEIPADTLIVTVNLNTSGSMLLTSVTAQFPGATGLKFRNPSTNTVRGVRMQGEVGF